MKQLIIMGLLAILTGCASIETNTDRISESLLFQPVDGMAKVYVIRDFRDFPGDTLHAYFKKKGEDYAEPFSLMANSYAVKNLSPGTYDAFGTAATMMPFDGSAPIVYNLKAGEVATFRMTPVRAMSGTVMVIDRISIEDAKSIASRDDMRLMQ